MGFLNIARLAALLAVAVSLKGEILRAQQCWQPGSDPRAAFEAAARLCSPELLYKSAAVLEDRALPELRAAQADSQVCVEIRRATRAALAKLGDATARSAIVNDLRTEKLNAAAIRDLGLIGDDRALEALMTYMVERASDRSRIVSFGDYDYDPMSEISAVMREVAGRRLLKGKASEREAGRWDWKEWWDKNRGGIVSVPVYQSVTDPYLRCLARKADWGFPNALLEMASQRGKAAEETLRRFPRFSSRQALGTMDGNLEAALAKLGDQAAFSEITAELREARGSFRSAVLKLEYIGNQEAVGALVAALGVPTRNLTEAKAALSRPTDDRNERFLIEDRYRVEQQIDRENQIYVLQTLAHMVENPPLPADGPPTPESFQKWQDWWAKNRDKIEIVQTPRGKYE